MADGGRRAVFLDRDGTIIADAGYLHDPDLALLLPHAAAAIRRLNEAGWLVIVVTNQSGIARGLYTVADYTRVQERVETLLATEGARLDAVYFCAHHPRFTGPCECRKPGVKLFREAEQAFGIDLARSWWVGDRVSDVQPAQPLGGRGILVMTGEGPLHQGEAQALGVTVVADLASAVDEIVRQP
ncbi:MAG: D-glycero-alpha-D-manno-heptose-1,7-bisphosphate 7-phosphatase [Gemmatimonadales bacterium]